MKIITWNVNGLRAALGKGFLAWAQEQAPDVLCLQEIKARREQIDDDSLGQLETQFPHAVWNSAQRPGYSGVATLARQAPLETRLGLGVEPFDIEGRAICTRHADFLLFNLYFPNGQHDHARVPFKLDFYARLLEMCDELHARGEQVILCGDFNTAHREIDLRNPKENENTTGFLPEERVWVDHYLAHGFIDVYRHFYPEREQYTWWTYRFNARKRNIGWRLDYFLISEGLLERVRETTIYDETPGSDHCPVSLVLE